MHQYDFNEGLWSPLVPSGTVPGIRSCPAWTKVPSGALSGSSFPSLTNHSSSVYVFGGYDGVNRMNDLWEFCCDTNKWSAVPTIGQAPSPRYFHSCVIFGEFMYSFGGFNGTDRLSDMHILDFKTNCWSLMDTYGDVPSGRSSFVAHVYGNSLFVFGGYNGQVVLSDAFEFCFESVVIPPPVLLDDLRGLINNQTFSDVTFIVGGRPIYATRAHLAVRSDHFRAMLFGGMRESTVGSEIVIPDVQHEVFLKLLEYVYTDGVTDLSPELGVPLLIASEQFLMNRLKGLCENAVSRGITTDNVISVFITAHRHRATGLKDICLQYIKIGRAHV